MNTVHADIEDLAFTAMKILLLHEATEHGLPVITNDDETVEIGSDFGTLGVAEKSSGVRLFISADSPAKLHAVREGLVEHLVHHLPHLKSGLRWSDALKGDRRPPNFQFTEVVGNELVCTDFCRLKLRLSDIELFQSNSIHFRLLIPSSASAADKWPFVTETGQTVWPVGDHVLHRPVYTVQNFNSETAEITVDIFNHAEGRASEWARSLSVGSTVAMIGPGGGGVPRSPTLVLCGDETAFPAIARILRETPSSTLVECVLLSHNGDHDYPLPFRENVTVHWVESRIFVEQSLNVFKQLDGAYMWCAAGRDQIEALKSDAIFKSIPKTQKFAVQYWQAG